MHANARVGRADPARRRLPPWTSSFPPTSLALQERVRDFMQRLVLPSNRDWHRWADEGEYPLDVVDPIKAQAKAAGLWNLFLPGLRDDEPGTRLSNLDYAPLAEIMGRMPWASEVFNCSAPDSGNMELLHLFATPEQTAALAAPAAGRRDPLLLRDVGARRRLERRDQPADAHRPRRRRLRGQRPQVVHHRRAAPALRTRRS